jgi:micrococcal nuclease
VSKRATIVLALAALATAAGSTALGSGKAGSETVARIDHVADGDTVDLTNGQRVRLVQIDTPEVYFGMECYGPQASATTKPLLRPGTLVRLLVEPKADRVDQYGRLLRYVIRARDGLNLLERRARARQLGLWRACPGTPYRPTAAVDTGPPR